MNDNEGKLEQESGPVTADPYPESNKLHKVAPYSQKCGEFIDWLASEKNAFLAVEVNDSGRWVTTTLSIPIQRLLAEFFGIDEVKLEQERRAMLDKMSQAS